MAAQLSYDINSVQAYDGLIYAQTPNAIDSFSVETPAGIPFGRAVTRGTDGERQVVLGGADPATFVGVTVRELTREGDVNTAASQYDENTTAAVLRTGYFWAVTTAPVVAGDSVTYDAGTGELSTAVGIPIVGAKWRRKAGTDEISVVHIQTSFNV